MKAPEPSPVLGLTRQRARKRGSDFRSGRPSGALSCDQRPEPSKEEKPRRRKRHDTRERGRPRLLVSPKPGPRNPACVAGERQIQQIRDPREQVVCKRAGDEVDEQRRRALRELDEARRQPEPGARSEGRGIRKPRTAAARGRSSCACPQSARSRPRSPFRRWPLRWRCSRLPVISPRRLPASATGDPTSNRCPVLRRPPSQWR